MAFQSGKLRISRPEYIIHVCVGRTSGTLIPQRELCLMFDGWDRFNGCYASRLSERTPLSIPRSALMFGSFLIVDLIATLKIGDYD